LVLLTVLLLAAIGWRYAVRNNSLPCPGWLIPLLENPYMNWVAGSSVVLDRAGIESGMNVLDVGCGPGRLAIPAADRVGPAGQVAALDVQRTMLRRLEQRIAERRLTNIRTIHSGVGEGAVEKDAFDRALLVTVLGEISQRSEALREIYGALKVGGVLSVTEVIPDPHYQRRSTVRALAEAAGFQFEGLFGGVLAYTMNFRKK
jgi:ubiquinone/menaquinone biosynthesis C-methylase UbiE